MSSASLAKAQLLLTLTRPPSRRRSPPRRVAQGHTSPPERVSRLMSGPQRPKRVSLPCKWVTYTRDQDKSRPGSRVILTAMSALTRCDRYRPDARGLGHHAPRAVAHREHRVGVAAPCLLYTSDAADEEDSVDLGGRRISKK